MQQLRLMWESDMDVLDWGTTSVPEKPVLIISCCEDKADIDGVLPAIDLYQGQMFQFIKANDFFQAFNIFILSAKWGLISASEEIGKYDLHMGEVDPQAFLELHSKGMYERLRTAAAGQRIYSFLPKAYRSVFESFMASSQGEKIKSLSLGFYSCWHHRGSGELKERMSKALRYELIGVERNPFSTVYRSGTASNLEEIIGYTAGGQSIGSSLWHLRDQPKAKRSVILAAFQNRVFVDNGMLQTVKKGLEIDPVQMLAEYESFISDVKQCCLELAIVDESHLPDGVQDCLDVPIEDVLSNFTFVVPDNPYSPEGALEFISDNLEQLKRFQSNGVELIIPVHKRCDGKPEDIRERVRKVYSLFGESSNIRIGIPTLDTEERPYALTSPMIESILSLKGDNGFLVKKVHFLGQGDTNNYLPTRERNLLAMMYEVDVTVDSCRTRPTFKSKYVQQNADDFIRDEEMKLLSSVVRGLRESEMEDPQILEKWRAIVNEHGIAVFSDLWNSSVRHRCDQFSIVGSCDEFSDDEELFDEFMSFYLSSGQYVDFWVNLNRKEYLDEHRIEPLLGSNKRSVILGRVFGEQVVDQSKRRVSRSWGEVIASLSTM
ncbi:hypothetical protein F7U66_02000 [Vibrio parahaemolyticus]|nr:hypothetical protein [Vibrio parahaemolyticus]